jgi:SnoaL-like domain
MNSPTAAEVTALLAQWWHLYDAGEIEALGPLLTDDAGFRCRTDTGETDWEEFVRFDVSGRDTILYWQRKHRDASPHPLRHMTLNVVVDPVDGSTSAFTSYLFVTQVVGGRPDAISSGILSGEVSRTEAGLQLSDFELTLDTQESIPLEERRQ